MNIPWDKIIDAVIQLVTMCLAQGTEETAVKERLANPGPLDWLRFRRLLRQGGLRGAELREAMEAARKTAYASDDDLLNEVIDQAKAA